MRPSPRERYCDNGKPFAATTLHHLHCLGTRLPALCECGTCWLVHSLMHVY